MRRLFFLICMANMGLQCYAQKVNTYYPKVGESLPDYTFTEFINYTKKTLSVSNRNGKWLVLDYWSEGCAGCLASFPKMDKLSKDFESRVDVMMVGAYNTEKDRVKTLFKRRCKNYRLTFASAFDSTSVKKYAIGSVPAIFVVNPNGIIVAKTASLDSNILSKLLNGEVAKTEKSYSDNETREYVSSGYTPKLPLLSNGVMANGGIDTSFMYRSILTRWNSNMPEYFSTGFNESQPEILKGAKGYAEILGLDLNEIFWVAYTGRPAFDSRDSLYGYYNPSVVFETKNTSLFRKRNVADARSSENSWAYSLKIPSEVFSPKNARRLLLEDLHKYLNCESHVEERKFDVYNLVVTDAEKAKRLLMTKGYLNAVKSISQNQKLAGTLNKDSTAVIYLSDFEGEVLYNFSINNLLRDGRIFNHALAALYKFDYYEVPPVINQTGIDYNVDFKFIGDERDYVDLMKNLHRYGLDLIKGKKMLKCIVVNDARIGNK